MKIAIGSDDRKNLAMSHFGDSHYYQVLEILNAKRVKSEWRENPYSHSSGNRNKRHGNSQKIIKLLEDCSLFLGRRFGHQSVQYITAQGIDCIATEINTIEQAVSSYLDAQDKGFAYYDKVKKAFVQCPQAYPPKRNAPQNA